jgi:hypothetical protein
MVRVRAVGAAPVVVKLRMEPLAEPLELVPLARK